MDIIYSHNNNWFHVDFAERLFHDLPEPLKKNARLLNVVEYLDVEPADHVVVINWMEAVLEPTLKGRETTLRDRVAGCSRRSIVSAECAGTPWYRRQFEDGIEWSDMVDIGWYPQVVPPEHSNVPYRFLYNSLTAREREIIAAVRDRIPDDFAGRPIPWTFIAASTPDRVAFADDLVAWEPRGFLFLPPVGPARPNSGRIEHHHLDRILRASKLYIWRAHHDFPYFETFRVLDALLRGALPIKIDPLFADRFHETGCVFADLTEMEAALEGHGAAATLDRLCADLLARPTLGRYFQNAMNP